jgi:hypothetical protein
MKYGKRHNSLVSNNISSHPDRKTKEKTKYKTYRPNKSITFKEPFQHLLPEVPLTFNWPEVGHGARQRESRTH